MMLLYVFFILLPATALAECPTAVLTNLFVALDVNNDRNVELRECVNLFFAFDVDKDGNITVREVEQVSPAIAPSFVGFEQILVDFLDTDRDGRVTFTDVLLEYYRADTNKNALKSRIEYDRYVTEYCRRVNGNNQGLPGLLCGLYGCRRGQ